MRVRGNEAFALILESTNVVRVDSFRRIVEVEFRDALSFRRLFRR